jgi:hypothetical protein
MSDTITTGERKYCPGASHLQHIFFIYGVDDGDFKFGDLLTGWLLF